MPLDAPDDRPMRGPSPYDPAAQAALIDYATALAGGGPAIPRVSLAGADVAAGGEAYRLQCAACHSWGGNGGALVGREAPPVQPATPVEVAEAIRIGPGEMPAFGTAAVSDRQLADLVAFTTSLDRPDDRGGADLGHLGPVAEGAVALVVGLGLLVLSVLWIGERT
jgi:ubiquinol-cytochrome c reductase cytochrome c subunit